MKDIRHNKKGFYTIIGINYIAILIYNFLTPPMSDDLYLKPGVYKPLSEILHACWIYYNNWLGRIESEFYTRISDAFPKPVYNIVSSVFFIALIIALYCNIEKEEKYDNRILALISLYIWVFGIDFAQTMLWVCGACNYLWCLAIEFGFLAYYRYKINNTDSNAAGKIWNRLPGLIGIFLWGLLAGNGNESSSGGVFLLVLYFTFKTGISKGDEKETYFARIKKGFTGFEISGIAGFALGIIIMVIAPGNRIRGKVNVSEESQTGLLRYLARFIKINDIVVEYMAILIVVAVVLLVYIHLYHDKRLKDLCDIYIYIVVAAIAIYVLILTTIPMPRAFMGGSLILLLACLQLIQYIGRNDAIINTMIVSAIVVMFLFMAQSYVDNAANLVRILRELNIRQEYVDEQKALGKDSLELPMLRKEWDNRYTFIYHHNDVNEEPDSFGNRIYRAYYGLDEVIGIPWEEWENRIQ